MMKRNLTFVLGFLMVLAMAVSVSAVLTNEAPNSISPSADSVSFIVNEINGSSIANGTTNNGNLSINGNNVTISDISGGFDNIVWEVLANDGNQTGSSISRVYDYCGSMASSSLNIVDYTVTNDGRGDDEEWEYLDSIEIEVEVENPTSDDIEDVLVEIVILDENGLDVTGDFDFDDDQIDLGRVKDDDSEVANFVIDSVNVEDVDKGDYRIYIRAYSEEDDKCTEDIDGDDYLAVEVVSDLEDDFLVDETDTFTASCGDNGVSVGFDVWNLGDEKEDKVLVNLYSSALGVDEYAVIDDLRSGKEERVNFIFDMPDYVPNNYYNFEVFLYYEYDSDDGEEFQEVAYGEEVEDTFQIRLNVDQCAAPEPTVGVATDDEIKVGNEFSFEVSVKNNAPNRQSIIVSLDGVDSWAKDVSIDPAVITLDGDETGTVTITMTAEDEGSQSFNVKTTIGTETYSQPVSVDVESKWALGKYFSMDYWEYWVAIGLIVLILIVLIVIIAVVRR